MLPRYFVLLAFDACTLIFSINLSTIICSIFPAESFSRHHPLDAARDRFYLNARPLCAASLFLFYRRTYASVRVLFASWCSAHPYFFEKRRRVLPRAKSLAKRIEVGATDKRETRLKKSNFHAAVKHSRKRFEQDPRFCCPLQLAFPTLQWSLGD